MEKGQPNKWKRDSTCFTFWECVIKYSYRARQRPFSDNRVNGIKYCSKIMESQLIQFESYSKLNISNTFSFCRITAKNRLEWLLDRVDLLCIASRHRARRPCDQVRLCAKRTHMTQRKILFRWWAQFEIRVIYHEAEGSWSIVSMNWNKSIQSGGWSAIHH